MRLRRHRPDGVPVYAWVGHPGGPPVGTVRFRAAHTGDPVPATLDAVEAGDLEVVVDDWSAMVKASLARGPREFYARFLPA